MSMMMMMMMEVDLMMKSNDALDNLNHFPLAALSIDCECSHLMLFVYLRLLSSVAAVFVAAAVEEVEAVWGEEVALLMVHYE